MKTRSILLIITLLALGLVLGGTVSAQAPEPGRPAGASYRPPAPDVIFAGDEAKPFVRSQATAGSLTSAAAPDIVIGQPGLSFRYERMFGETRVPYLADTAHLHHPYGVTVAGDRLWIAESEGLRALQFNTSGAFVSQIGRAGIHDVWEYGAPIDFPSDVGVAPDGHIWLVNKWAYTLLEFDSAGNYLQEMGVRWNCVADNTGFCFPTSVAFDAYGNRFISDSDNHRIQVYDSSGNYQATIGVSGVPGSDRDHLNNPQHIAIYDGLLYVADSRNHRVQIFNIAIPGMYTWAGTIGFRPEGGSGPGELMWPAGVAVDANYIYVADAVNHRVSIYHRGTQAYAATLGTGWGTGSTEFRNPRDVAVDAAGNIYVADWNNCRVQQFDSNRNYVRTFGTTGVPYVTDGYHYNNPFGVATGPDSSLYILEERSSHRLVKLNAEGVFQWSVGEPGIEGGWDAGYNTHFNWPGDVSVDGAGRVYVADSGNDRIQVYDASGNYLSTLGAWGAGNTQFKHPLGLFSRTDGSLYVADRDNQRVQIFNSARQYVATLGVTGQAGADNAHFNGPADVAVDGRGWIYVSDAGNQRVQVFDAQRRYVRTIGVTGEGGDDYAHLGDPNKLAVDAQDRLYIADGWSNRVMVYDANGAFLTMISGSDGARPGDLRGATGVAVDADGAVYVTDFWDNARVQKFAAGVPGWRQVNINGFGDRWSTGSGPLAAFAGSLYHGTGAQLWRMNAQGVWALLCDDGLGDPNNWFNYLFEFKGQLYAGLGNSVCDDPDCNTSHSNGGEVWRSSDGTAWSRVVSGGFGDTTNAEVQVFTEFGGQLYAATWSYSDEQGMEIWRSSTGSAGDWTRVVSNGFGDPRNTTVLAFAAHNGYLYAGLRNAATGGEVWRTADGTTWTQINADGFGDAKTIEAASLSDFGGSLYAGAYNRVTGAQVWRCNLCDGSDWSSVVGDGFGHVENRRVAALTIFNGALYAVTNNYGGDGMEVRRTTDGVNWAPAAPAGFGDSNNRGPCWGYSVAIANGRLYIGTSNNANGAEIWVKTLTADFTATPTRGAPPLAVQFSNTSSGDFTTSSWDFGDGGTSNAISPTHTYTAAGTYTVTLTVGDGAETSTLTKPTYIDVHQRLFLPLTMRNWDPLRYDDFNDPAWEGAWNPAKWSWSGQDTAFQARQQNGAMVFTNSSGAAAGNAALMMEQPERRSLAQLRLYEARMKISSDRTGGSSAVWIHVSAGSIAGHQEWLTECGLHGQPSRSANASCSIMTTQDGQGYNVEYWTPTRDIAYDTWYTIRMEFDPTTAGLRFYLNNDLIGSHVPQDAAALLAPTTTLRPIVAVLNFQPNTSATRYVDDVRITPAR